jgi:hypothetical protein
MPNYAYAGFWLRGYTEANMLEDFRTFLELFPCSKTRPGFHSLTIRAVDAAQAVLIQRDFRWEPLPADEWLEIAREFLHDDSAYETLAYWDLWTLSRSAEGWQWRLQAQPVELICHGAAYDDGVCRELGHFHLFAGPEHFFLGRGDLAPEPRGLPALEGSALAASTVGPELPTQDLEEERQRVSYLRDQAHGHEYLAKTQENIRRLFGWTRKVERTLPVERVRLWSEGEEDFRERMEAILAATA